MKKKSTSQSAPACCACGEAGFFNPRVLIGLVVIPAGVFLALPGFGASSAQAQAKYRFGPASIDPLVPAGFDCAKIRELGINKQENLRAGAIMIACGEAEGGSASPGGAFSQIVQELLQPAAYGTTDAAASRALEDIRLPLLGTRIAGHITAFTATTTTIENLVGRITTHLLLSTVGCTLPGTTLMLAAEPSSFVTQLITVSPGPMRDRSRAALHSSATCRSPATWPQATCTSLEWT